MEGWCSRFSMPAGNCKLQTLRLRLPERGAHTALGDVFTVADLFAKVLRPIAEQRGLATWEQLEAYAAEEWYPSRIAFGKHKGKSIAETCNDTGLRGWLDGLARSANARGARSGSSCRSPRRFRDGSLPKRTMRLAAFLPVCAFTPEAVRWMRRSRAASYAPSFPASRIWPSIWQARLRLAHHETHLHTKLLSAAIDRFARFIER